MYLEHCVLVSTATGKTRFEFQKYSQAWKKSKKSRCDLRSLLFFVCLVRCIARNKKSEHNTHSLRMPVLPRPSSYMYARNTPYKYVLSWTGSPVQWGQPEQGSESTSVWPHISSMSTGGLFVYWQWGPRWGRGVVSLWRATVRVSLRWPLPPPVISPKDGRCVLFNLHC